MWKTPELNDLAGAQTRRKLLMLQLVISLIKVSNSACMLNMFYCGQSESYVAPYVTICAHCLRLRGARHRGVSAPDRETGPQHRCATMQGVIFRLDCSRMYWTVTGTTHDVEEKSSSFGH